MSYMEDLALRGVVMGIIMLTSYYSLWKPFFGKEIEEKKFNDFEKKSHIGHKPKRICDKPNDGDESGKHPLSYQRWLVLGNKRVQKKTSLLFLEKNGMD